VSLIRPALDVIDSADVNTVRTDDFHMFFNDHLIVLCELGQRTGGQYVQAR
jgi:hypothetical protein